MSLELTVIPKQKTKPRHLKKVMNLESLWIAFVQLKGDLAPETLLKYKWIGDKFVGFMNNKTFQPFVLARFVQDIQQKSTIKNNQINRIIFTVRSFLKFLKTMRYLEEDLSDALKKLPPNPVKNPEIMTEDEYIQIKKYCEGRAYAQPALWAIILGYRTGMSLVDCCHLRWRDVYLNDNGPSYIKIYRQKVKRKGETALCQIPIIPGTDVYEWLLMLKAAPRSQYVRRDGIYDYVHQDLPDLYIYPGGDISSVIKSVIRKSGVRKCLTHKCLRSTFISNLVNAGTPYALICKMTGHQSMKTMLMYLIPDRQSLQDGLHQSFKFAESNRTITRNSNGICISPVPDADQEARTPTERQINSAARVIASIDDATPTSSD